MSLAKDMPIIQQSQASGRKLFLRKRVQMRKCLFRYERHPFSARLSQRQQRQPGRPPCRRRANDVVRREALGRNEVGDCLCCRNVHRFVDIGCPNIKGLGRCRGRPEHINLVRNRATGRDDEGRRFSRHPKNLRRRIGAGKNNRFRPSAPPSSVSRYSALTPQDIGIAQSIGEYPLPGSIRDLCDVFFHRIHAIVPPFVDDAARIADGDVCRAG